MDVRNMKWEKISNLFWAIQCKNSLFIRAYIPFCITRGSYPNIFGAYFGQIKSDTLHSKLTSLVDASYDNI